ncbi:MAG: IS110 family transposase [Rhodocyclaceae bacterium]|nr:IS110 family transposase [Rhodocyclaceae bacterium]
MEHFAAIDVSLEASSLCVVDGKGTIIREVKAASEPQSLAAALAGLPGPLVRVGLEAGPLSQWLHAGLTGLGLPVVCLETRHLAATLRAMPNKTDRNDARGMAQAVRTGWFRQVHVKSLPAQEARALLAARQLLVRQVKDVGLSLRGLLRNFGLKLGAVGKAGLAARVRELLAGSPRLLAIAESLLAAHAALSCEVAVLHRRVLATARNDEVCRRLMTAPGVGPVVALAFKSAIDDPDRFARSRAVGAHFGLTPRRWQSGEVDRAGHITRAGDAMLRTLLYEAATVLLTRTPRWSSLKAWGVRLAERQGSKRARVGIARKLAVILHRMWRDGSAFNWGEPAAAPT